MFASHRPPRFFPIVFVPLVIATLLAAAAPAAPAGKPIPCGPDAHTQRDVDKQRLQWNLATVVEAYKQIGLRNPAWDDAAIKLLDAWARAFQVPLTPARMVDAGQAAVKLGCNDPMVLLALATGLSDSGNYAEAETVAARAVEGLQQVAYPRCRAWAAAQLSAALYRRSGKKTEADRQMALCVQWIAQAAAEKAVTDGYQRQFWGRLSAALDDPLADQRKAIGDALRAQAVADPWIVAMCDGTYRVKRAWEARGNSYAGGVTAQGWKGFGDNLDAAKKALTEAWKLHPEYPEAASEMIAVAMGEERPDESTRTWFDRAVAAQLDWMPAYEALEYSLRTRWGGSDETLYAFGLECLATKRFDTAVPYQLRECLRDISDEDDSDDWWFKPGVYDSVHSMYEGLLGDTTNGLDAARLGGQYTAAAWLCGAYEDANRQWGILGGRMDAGVVQQEFGEIIPLVVGGVISCTGPQAAAAKEAEGLYRKGDPQALARFEALLPQVTGELPQRYVSDRIARLRLEAAFAKGDPVKLVPPDSNDGWQCEFGGWRWDDKEGWVETTTPAWSAIICSLRPSGGFEVRGEIEFPEGVEQISGGVIVGFHRGCAPYWTSAQINRADNRLNVGNSFYRGTAATVADQRRHEIVARVWERKLTVYVDGERAVDEVPLSGPPHPAPPDLVGFGSGYNAVNGKPVRYLNFRIQRLVEKPDNPVSLPAAPQH